MKRPGKTEKISVSLDVADLAVLRRRARRRHAGNLSAAVAEGIHRVAEEEGREALGRWLAGRWSSPTRREMQAIRSEWRGKKKRSAAA